MFFLSISPQRQAYKNISIGKMVLALAESNVFQVFSGFQQPRWPLPPVSKPLPVSLAQVCSAQICTIMDEGWTLRNPPAEEEEDESVF